MCTDSVVHVACHSCFVMQQCACAEISKAALGRVLRKRCGGSRHNLSNLRLAEQCRIFGVAHSLSAVSLHSVEEASCSLAVHFRLSLCMLDKVPYVH